VIDLEEPTPRNIQELEDALSAPTPALIDAMRRLSGDILFLGVAGKMGPTMARMARRATDLAGVSRRIIGVSRFSSADLIDSLNRAGIETIRCDLLDENAVKKLPDAPHVISMSGFKFGAQSNPPLTWAMNCYVPAVVSRRFRASRIVAFSSGNVYPHVPVTSGGSVETDAPRPVGEYAISVLGRERIYEYFSSALPVPMALLRLNYATELRYGVLVDLAQQVWNGREIDLSMGHVNVIWQAEANAMSLQMLEHTATPPCIMNIAGPEIVRVRDVCEEFGRILGRTPCFVGSERPEALLNNAGKSYALLGTPQVTVQQMIRWTADWVRQGRASLNKPTHFDSVDGKY
jgi:nucleoside-diphosphate-sugar epimerase